MPHEKFLLSDKSHGLITWIEEGKKKSPTNSPKCNSAKNNRVRVPQLSLELYLVEENVCCLNFTSSRLCNMHRGQRRRIPMEMDQCSGSDATICYGIKDRRLRSKLCFKCGDELINESWDFVLSLAWSSWYLPLTFIFLYFCFPFLVKHSPHKLPETRAPLLNSRHQRWSDS